MDHVNLFLRKFKRVAPPHKEVRENFSKICQEILGRRITPLEIRVSNKTLYIDTTPFLKNEIYLHKKTLLDRLNENLDADKSTVTDIR